MIWARVPIAPRSVKPVHDNFFHNFSIISIPDCNISYSIRTQPSENENDFNLVPNIYIYITYMTIQCNITKNIINIQIYI